VETGTSRSIIQQ